MRVPNAVLTWELKVLVILIGGGGGGSGLNGGVQKD